MKLKGCVGIQLLCWHLGVGAGWSFKMQTHASMGRGLCQCKRSHITGRRVLSVRTFTHTFSKNLVPSQASCNNCQVFSLVSSKYLTFSVCSFFMMKLECLNSLLKESCSHKNKHLDIHWDFYANICNSIDTILSSWCVASNKIFFFVFHLFLHVVDLPWICLNCQKWILNLLQISLLISGKFEINRVT